MSEDIKIYHVETQEDYDDLMIKLEEQGCMWRGRHLPTTQKKNWSKYKKSTYIALYEDSKVLGFGSMSYIYSVYPEYPKNIIKYKAKGVNKMEKVVVPQFVVKWFENVSEKELGGNDIFRIIQDVLRVSHGQRTWNDYDVDEKLVSWVEENEETFLHLIVNCTKGNGYEAEEEKEYHWKRKSELSLKAEEPDMVYLNYYVDKGTVFFGSIINGKSVKTKLTEKEVLSLVGEEDFKKLEKVEIKE